MTLLAGFDVLLGRLAGQEDVVVGLPIAGRERPEVQGLIGMFLNTLVLRADLSGAPAFAALLAAVRETALAAYAHQELPFEKLLDELRPERDLSRTPLFQVFFNMLNFPAATIELPGLTVEPLSSPEVPAKFDLTVYVSEPGEGIHCELVYNADLFDAARIAEMARQYEAVLAQAAADPEAPIDRLSLVTPAPSATSALLPDPRLPLSDAWMGAVHERFAEWARRDPGRPAVVDDRESWSYGELDERADRLARRLRAGGVTQGDVVAIYGHRSVRLVWAVLGVMKAGAAFTVLDPAHPPARLIDCLSLATPRGWIALAAAGPVPQVLNEFLADSGCLCKVILPLPGEEADLTAISADPLPQIGPDDIAYVAFTSGSTGIPKGILGRHGPLSHFIPWQQRRFGLGETDRFSMLSGLAHDPLQRDMFTPLQIGGTICVPDPADIPVPGRLAEWMRRQRVTVAHLTPAMGQILTEIPPDMVPPRLDALRWAFLVGDVLTRRDVARLRELAPGLTCVNFYGSTETQRSVGYHEVGPGEAASGWRGKESLPLGRGVEGVQLLVVNRAGERAGVGELGEIYVRGHHLARGYLGDPEGTAAKFLDNPFGGRPGDRVYRTGDLGRYLPDGEVEFAGRADFQVKIRGFRIEPGEIEALLAGNPAVRDCAVVARDAAGGEKRLVAYVVPERPGLTVAELRLYTKERLPDYMVPSAFVLMEKLPVTPNNKLDRRALPDPGPTSPASGDTSPRTPVEEVLAGIWSEVLRIERVCPQDGFFDLGGHSLLATRMIARVQSAFGVDLPLRVLFETPTLEAFAQQVEQARADAAPPPPPLRPVSRTFDIPLSFAQQRLWVLHQLKPESPVYNMPFALRLAGRLDEISLLSAVEAILWRQEALRTTFEEKGDHTVQLVHQAPLAGTAVLDLTTLPATVREEEFRRQVMAEAARPFDLRRGPLVRTLLVHLGPEDHGFLCVLHHIVFDGWSKEVFIRELIALYRAFRAGKRSPLPELPVQYADFTIWQQRHLVLDAELAYWREHLASAPALIKLPTDHPRPEIASFRGVRHTFEIPQDLSEILRALSRQENCTLFMTLLAAFYALLYRYSGEEDIVVGSPVHGRSRPEIRDVIGFFSNILLFRVDLSGNPSFRELMARVRKVVLDAFRNEHVPFERLVSECRPERNLGYNPLFQVSLAFQTIPEEAMDVPELSLSPVQFELEVTPFDLILSIVDTPALTGTFQYSVELFEEVTVIWMREQLQVLLENVTSHPDTRLDQLRSSLENAARKKWSEVKSELDRSNSERFQQRRRQVVAVSGS